jgi:hypothetical protein
MRCPWYVMSDAEYESLWLHRPRSEAERVAQRTLRAHLETHTFAGMIKRAIEDREMDRVKTLHTTARR